VIIERYRTERHEWVVGASIYRGPRGWTLNLELGRWIVTAWTRR
jgi:hypothetical protein